MSSLDWKFSQVFGDKSPSDEVTDVDIVSSLAFDDTGEFLAAGDRGGRLVVFERQGGKGPGAGEYRFYTEFQSHEPEFDYLKSLEIEEKINRIRWMKRQSAAHFLITTNDKTIKLWKVYERRTREVLAGQENAGLRVPQIRRGESVVAATPRRVFSNAHAYHINSIALNSDSETFLSADDLRINLWNLSISEQSFNIVDIKPANMEELTEVITAAECHPIQCNTFMYSSSKGTIKLADMRSNALCDDHAKIFEEEEDPKNRSFFSEIISSISDIQFTRDGRYILSRDYLTLKLWDMNMESRPVKTIQIHNHLRSKLCDLYENDCIFDKFECTVSHDGEHVLTGSYHNYFHIYDKEGKTDTCIEASKFAQPPKESKRKGSSVFGGKKKKNKNKEETNPDNIDFSKKVLHLAWHPHENVVAAGAMNHLFIYSSATGSGE